MRCCPNCFTHPWLQDYVRTSGDDTGICEFCGSAETSCVEVAELYPLFANLVSIYKPLVDGQTIDKYENPLDIGDLLLDLVQEDWDVFSETLNASDKAEELFDMVMAAGWDDDSGEPLPQARDLYTRRRSLWHTSMAEDWEEYSRTVKEDPEAELQLPEMFDEVLGRAEITLLPGTILFRARIGFVKTEEGQLQPYRGRDMGAPPSEKARAGRANKGGKPVFYCADREPTVIAEVRPSRGLWVSVCEARVRRELRILDLSRDWPLPNPFVEEFLGYELELRGLLSAFGEELGRPLRRTDAVEDYLPCQKLAEVVERSGFDGIRYPSAMAPEGTNIVLFDPAVVAILESKLVEVEQLSVEYTVIPKWRLREA